MYTRSSMCRLSIHHHHIILLTLMLPLAVPLVVSAQQPTATISRVSGTVIVAFQGSAAVAVTAGVILQAGDVIEIGTGATVVLTLSEGSEIRLGPNSKLDLAVLAQRPGNARTSRLKLFYGRLRAFLSPGHQEEGSSFTVETPNALAGVKFSQPDIEVSYDPGTQTTLILAHTVDVLVENLETRESRLIPPGTQAIVQSEFIRVIEFTPQEPSPTEQPPAQEAPSETEEFPIKKKNLLLRTQQSISLSVSTNVPVSISPGSSSRGGSTPDTSSNPSPTSSSNPPGVRYDYRTFTINVNN